MAIDNVSGMIQWVVGGNLVENNTNVYALKDSRRPINLSGKIILGAYQVPTKSWQVFSNKLTNLNIFYGLLSIPSMQRRTKEDEVCLEEGDYLPWSKMKWEVRGVAFIENIRPEEFATKPMLNFYPAPFPRMDCKHFCENLGTRMPSVSNSKELGRLQGFCGEKMKGVSHGVWLAIDDNEEEGTMEGQLNRPTLELHTALGI